MTTEQMKATSLTVGEISEACALLVGSGKYGQDIIKTMGDVIEIATRTKALRSAVQK